MTNKASFIKIIGMVCAIFAVLSLTSALAFGQAEQGTIVGVVRDATGAVVADAKVVVRNSATGAERTATTNNLGQYTVPALTPSKYDVVVSKSGFKTYKVSTEVTVGTHLTIDAQLAVGSSNTVVEVVAGGVTEVNTQSQEVSQLIDTQQMAMLPSLTRNAYDFVALSGNVSNGDTTSNGGTMTAGAGGGQELTLRGVGYNINGQRSSGTEILLDGVENIAVFSVTPGDNVPVDAVQEYSVITNNYGAEYGRASGGVVNVTTKAGTNSWHGSVWEFNRLAAYTANTFDNDASGLAKGGYTRNQFGGQGGGALIKNKLFVSGAVEFTRVRANSIQHEEIFDPAFINLLPANAKQYFQTVGSPAPTGSPVSWWNSNDGVTTGGGWLGALGGNPMVNGTTPIPFNTPVMDQINFAVPFNDGGGLPGNEYSIMARGDYNISDKTQLFFRFAKDRELFFNGGNSYGAYSQYDTGALDINQGYLLSVNHEFSSTLVNSTKLDFSRFFSATSYSAPTLTPNLMFYTPTDLVTGGLVSMPGLENASAPGSGGVPFGGPQNNIQAEDDLSWSKGRHSMKFGGQFTYIQLNVAYGAYAQAVEQLGPNTGASMLDLINAAGNPLGSTLGGNAGFSTRVNPDGVLPCHLDVNGNIIQSPSCAVTPPLSAASYARSYRYKDWAIYAQDSFRLTPRFTLNYGLRWEHFGVQHNDIQTLDSNFYFGSGSGFFEQVRNGEVQIAPQSSVGQFWKPTWGTLGPRVGFAYDLFGDGKTSLRGGFGISYERNFGNVTFNASFNPPGSAVVEETCTVAATCPYAVTTNDLGPLGQPGPPSYLPPAELRMPQPNIHTAQTQFWSMDLQREVARNTIVDIGYNGAHGVHLYDINNINNLGMGQIFLGDPAVTSTITPTSTTCDPGHVSPSGICLTRPNNQFAAINMRGSGGSSSYNAFNIKFQTQNLRGTGVSLVANYTWSHSLDDESTTFSDSTQGGSGSGYGSLGYTSVVNPKLDWGPSDFDVRHRVVVSPMWATPWFKSGKGLGEALGGWNVIGIFTARTGIPFTVYDLTDVAIGYTLPRLTPATPVTAYSVSSNPAPIINPATNTALANRFSLLTLPQPNSAATLNPVLGLSDYGPSLTGTSWPSNMTGRNAFRGPGAWNLDTAVEKDFKLTERFGLNFRAEGFNIFNHHNLYTDAQFLAYGIGLPSFLGSPLVVPGLKGGLNSIPLTGNFDERRFGQFSLRFTF